VSKQTNDSHRTLAVMILAASDGATLNSRRPLALHQAGGRSLAGHAVAAALSVAKAEDVLIVAGSATEPVRAVVAATGVQVMSHAAVAGYDDVLLLPCNVPLLTPASLTELVHAHRTGNVAATLLAASLDEQAEYGREARVGVFRVAALPAHPEALLEQGAQQLAEKIRHTGSSFATVLAADPAELWEADSVAELVAIDASLRASKASALIAAGVTIYRPETCVIDAEVEVAPDTVIEPFVQLLGHTRVGTETHIRSYSVIQDCTIGDRVLVLPGCVLKDSVIEQGANIGPMTHMRPGCTIGEDAHLGAFVETKKARLGKGVKAGHLAYLGDAEVGAGTNIGAGVITCNYDGVHKHPTHIGEGAFVGSDSTLVAPVSIGPGAYVGAGSCITHDVPADALAIGRARQIIKEGWAAVRRTRHKAQG
jgi:bifunctional UDP-N-acetylglucosamine pyrophosphorylase / glucosamine-1-phosphate N-acetyltransferase